MEKSSKVIEIMHLISTEICARQKTSMHASVLQVNIAFVHDCSSSVNQTHFDIGGSASYVQFSWGVDDLDAGIFYS